VDDNLIGELIDAAVQDPPKARQMLDRRPELLVARYLHEETALHFLAVEGYTEAVGFLVTCGFDVNARNKFGGTALLDVCVLGNEEIARILLRHGADPYIGSETTFNALHASVRSANDSLIKLILDHGGRVDAREFAQDDLWRSLPRRNHNGSSFSIYSPNMALR
jgi:ankyrin repeat protein